MKFRTQALIITSSLFFLTANVAAQYQQTTGYQDMLQWADSLTGRDARTDPAFQSYCEQYATTSMIQARRRVSQQCTLAIPLSNNNIANRWAQNTWAHKSWCLSVSSPISRAELVTRESNLKNCVNQQNPINSNAITYNSCLANDQIHKQAARGNVAYVRSCLDAGVSPNTLESNGWTPLHSAARWGHMPVIRLLLSRGAKIYSRDTSGKTPLDQAKVGGFNNVINYLLSQGG